MVFRETIPAIILLLLTQVTSAHPNQTRGRKTEGTAESRVMKYIWHKYCISILLAVITHMFSGTMQSFNHIINASAANCKYQPFSDRCPAGTYRSGYMSSCEPCEGNTVSGAGAYSCTICSSGYVANAAHTKCRKCSL